MSTKTNSGWILVHRKLQKKGYYKDSHFIHLWLHLLLNASYEPSEFLWAGQIVNNKVGCLITGRKSLSRATGIQESKVERILKVLENEHQIKQQKTNRYRLITILNWEKHQKSEQQSEQQVNNKRTHINKYKEYKETIYSPDFELFWSSYPLKENKKTTYLIWQKISPSQELQDKIIKSVEKHKKTKKWEEGYIMLPSRFLNGEHWEDEIISKSNEEDTLWEKK